MIEEAPQPAHAEEEVHVPIARDIDPEAEPDTRIQDPDLAHGLANAEHAQNALELAAQNLDNSGLPKEQIAELQETIRERGNELAEEAVAEYEQAEARFIQVRDQILGPILAAAEGKLPEGESLYLLSLPLDGGAADPKDYYETYGREFPSLDGLTVHQQRKLQQAILAMLGVNEPKFSDFEGWNIYLGKPNGESEAKALSGAGKCYATAYEKSSLLPGYEVKLDLIKVAELKENSDYNFDKGAYDPSNEGKKKQVYDPSNTRLYQSIVVSPRNIVA